jgi:hypothetical protein
VRGMIAYLLMFLLCIYAVFSFFIVRFAVKKAVKLGHNPKVSIIIAIIVVAFPFIYMTIEYFITKVVFNNYCTKEAGVWIYKTVDQWKAENPGVAKTLKPYTDKNRPDFLHSGDGVYNTSSTEFLNPRFAWVTKKNGPLTANIFRRTNEIVDTKTGKVMARMIDFSSGYGNPFLSTPYGLVSYKVWLAKDNCKCYAKSESNFFRYLKHAKNIGEYQYVEK